MGISLVVSPFVLAPPGMGKGTAFKKAMGNNGDREHIQSCGISGNIPQGVSKIGEGDGDSILL